MQILSQKQIANTEYIEMPDKMDLLRLLFVTLQLPIIAMIIALCHRAILVLEFKPLLLVLLGFVFNLIYMALNVFASEIFITVFFDSRPLPNLSAYIELCDLITFGLFILAFCISRPKSIVSIAMSIIVMICLALWELLNPSNIYLTISSLYKAIAIILLIVLFSNKFFIFKAGRLWVLIGLLIWLVLQFPNMLISKGALKYDYFFFLLATFGKIFIAISLFREPILYEIFTSSKEKEKEFEKILETTFHEINLPMTAMELNLSKLSRADNSKGQKYQELESDFEKINTVIQNAQDAFKSKNSDNNVLTELSTDSVLNLNRIVQKCTINLKHQLADPQINFKIKFGRNVHALGNEAEITQIIVNLLKNAIEAYPVNKDEKEILIATGYLAVEESEKRTLPYVEITDYANGIRKKDIDKIWDRGYSTKKEKSIKGQGLYIVKQLTAKNSVKLELISNHIDETSYAKNVGSTFKLYFKNG